MILDQICAHKRQEIELRKQQRGLRELEEAIAETPEPRDFRQALRAEGISLIAEFKKRSPSKGRLIENADPLEVSGMYESAGARAISVLTEERFFDGSLQDLAAVRQSVSVPCLRKDFIFDEYQIYESRAHGADALLLIVRILSDQQIRDYLDLAGMLGMAVLAEAHTGREIERALQAGAGIIGINNRNLDTFAVDLNTTLELKKLVPGGHVLVSESGIYTRREVQMLEDGGIDAILVGEALVTSPNVRVKIRELLGHGEG